MTSIHQRISSPRQRRALQAVLLTSWLLTAGLALWNRSATAAVLLGMASGVLGLVALKIALVDASAVSALTKSTNARHRQTSAELARVDESIDEVEMLARLIEPYAALFEVQQQEILALGEQISVLSDEFAPSSLT